METAFLIAAGVTLAGGIAWLARDATVSMSVERRGRIGDLPRHVERLLAARVPSPGARARYPVLVVAPENRERPDEQLDLQAGADRVEVGFGFFDPGQEERIDEIRSLCAEHGLKARVRGLDRGRSRVACTAPRDAGRVAELAGVAMTRLHGVGRDTPLVFARTRWDGASMLLP